jgi:hypothetical protein
MPAETDALRAHLLNWELRHHAMASTLGNGLIAAIIAYYENYTDATELEPSFISAMDTLVEMAGLGVDVYEVIFEAEQRINASGGIQSETGGRHEVRTAHVWEEVQDSDG